jgi:hypothetical protein
VVQFRVPYDFTAFRFPRRYQEGAAGLDQPLVMVYAMVT